MGSQERNPKIKVFDDVRVYLLFPFSFFPDVCVCVCVRSQTCGPTGRTDGRVGTTTAAIVSKLTERITIPAFYPRRERGPRTFLKF